jgi:multidrug efflux system membrane fusion protein
MNRILLFAIAVPAVLQGCRPQPHEDQQETAPVGVVVTPVSRQAYRVPVRATGLLATKEQMKLSFKTGGIVKEVQAVEGRSYRKGDVLAVLDLSEVEASVSQARIGLKKAERDLGRARNLYRDSVATLEQYQNAQSAYELARSQVKIAEFNLQHSSIKAPADGKVQKVLVEASELIAPGHPAIVYASTEDDWIMRATLTDKDVVRISIGDSAQLRIDAFPGILFPGEVSELAPVADPVTGTYEAEIRIFTPDPQFRTGFFARTEIFPAEKEHALTVPLECLLDASDGQARVFVYEEGSVKMRRVVTGSFLEDRVVIREGLKEGEQVVTEGARYLRSGMKVRVTLSPLSVSGKRDVDTIQNQEP